MNVASVSMAKNQTWREPIVSSVLMKTVSSAALIIPVRLARMISFSVPLENVFIVILLTAKFVKLMGFASNV